MRRFSLLVALLSGCLHHHTYISADGTVLGRVVVYRNGVAFYERRATIDGGQLSVHVPRDRVDDFLKSLTVVDPATGKPLSVTIPRKEADDGSYLTMTLETPERRHADVLLTYVTEAPAWKPSYRLVVGDKGKVMLEGWAIVDNVSGEDWKGVLVGVGASSALSFRYDLWSVRHVDRDLLQGEDRFAIAPPTGVSPYADTGGEELAQLGGDEVGVSFSGDSSVENQYVVDGVSTGETIQIKGSAPTIDPTSTTQGMTLSKEYIKNVPVPGRTFESVRGAAAGSQSDADKAISALPAKQGDAKLHGIAAKIAHTQQHVVIETHAATPAEAQAKAAAVRDKLVDDGVAAARIHIVPKVAPGEAPRVRVLAVAEPPKEPTAPPAAHAAMPDTPVGESRFMADRPMTVRAGTSAMVAMVHHETTGGVVYLYDPISDRGDQRYAFKAVRLDNPTSDALEPGPVTVYGDGRFIGEGITEPVPPKASVVVPFALDRQIVVQRSDADSERIAKLVTVQRGVVTAEMQHRRQTKFTVTSRLGEPTTVYLRHKLAADWTLVEAPPHSMKVGDSQLFEVDLGPNETKVVTIAEATPVEKSLELASDEALDMMKVYIDEPAASPELRAQLTAALATHRAAADLVDKIQTLRDQLAEYRSRASELHAQLVTLKMVRSGADLTSALHKKLDEISDRIQKTTIAVVDAQEQLMLTRVKFQNQLADLHLTDVTATR